MTKNQELLNHFEAVRLRASNFCHDRNWEKFHLPTSLALALSGECGEVCEIFQWKGTIEQDIQNNLEILSEKEKVHVGEEIADVCIYTTRLCDICNINLGNVVLRRLNFHHSSLPTLLSAEDALRPWPTEINFDQISSAIENQVPLYRSHRAISLELQSEVGRLCSIFAKYSERDSNPGLSSWTVDDRVLLSNSTAQIFILMMCLANMCKLSIGKCITDKFLKNDAKYPVALAKGSSAKYTVYAKPVASSNHQLFITTAWITLAFASFCAGRYFSIPHNNKFF